MAEVTLTLSTDPSFERAVDGFIQISRRVFREGGSQYRLNGKVVRLKEIKDLLMDTGLGIRAYSVIEQGKIGMILSGKPQERRKLLEEAAGITRYKERKRIAEVKLEEALGKPDASRRHRLRGGTRLALPQAPGQAPPDAISRRNGNTKTCSSKSCWDAGLACGRAWKGWNRTLPSAPTTTPSWRPA